MLKIIWQSFTKRKILLFSLAVLIIVLPIAYFTLLYGGETEAAWMDDNWLYRKKVEISNSSGSTLTDFQVAITLDTASLISAGKMQADCDDIRITDVNGKVLSHWVEESGLYSCNDSDTKIWTKVPSLPTSGATVYVYYGNPSAINTENGDAVFEFFDDFSSNTLGTKWTGDVSNFSISGGLLTGSNNNYRIQSNISFTGDYEVITRTLTNTGANNGVEIAGFWASTSNSHGILNHSSGANWYTRNDGSWPYQGTFSFTQWVRAENKVVGTSATATLTGETSGTDTASNTNSGLSSEYIALGRRYDNNNYNQNYDVDWDWIFVRKAASTEPSASVSSTEEKSPGPVAYWKFDEGYGTTANDSTQNNNDGTITGATWKPESECISGKCLYFGGTAYGTVSDSSSLSSTQGLTVSFWVKFNTVSGYAGIVAKSSNGTSGNSWFIILDNNSSWKFGIYKTDNCPSWSCGTGLTTLTSNTPEPNTWYHVTATYKYIADGSSQMRFYVNGVLVASTNSAAGPIVDNVQPIEFGRWSNNKLHGYIDEVKIYPYARSAEQIKADYLAGLSGAGTAKGVAAALGAAKERAGGVNLSNGLVGYWKMDESSWTNDCSTATVIDSSGNGNNGKACPASTGPTGGAAGKFGNAGSFDGSDDYINTNTYFSTITSAITISVWVNPGATQVQYADIWGNHGEPYKGMVMQQDGANTNVFSWGYGDGSNWTSSGTTQLTANTWQHLVAVKDSSYCYIYVNGEEKNKGSCTTSIVPNSSLNFLIARGYASDRAFNGKIDEVRIYNRALSPREVRALYEWAPGPRVYLKLDEGSGTTANDSSGNNRAGTIFNALWSIGKFGKGLKLDGSGDYLQIPDF